jgi:hypothetical protein
MVIVDPDQITILDILDDSLGEQAIDFAISTPCGLIKGDFTRVIVEERP